MSELGGATTYPNWDCAHYVNGRPALLPAAPRASGFERCSACKSIVHTGRYLTGDSVPGRIIRATEPPFVCATCAAERRAA